MLGTSTNTINVALHKARRKKKPEEKKQNRLRTRGCHPATIVQKLWNYCNILRDDGLSYGDYVEQLTFLLFLKMADEQSRPPFNKPSPIPKDFDWQSLLNGRR